MDAVYDGTPVGVKSRFADAWRGGGALWPIFCEDPVEHGKGWGCLPSLTACAEGMRLQSKIMAQFLLVGAGIGVGAVASMLGIGGGVFMVPFLLLGGVVATSPEAVGTSAAAVMATGLASTVAYLRRRKTNWGVGLTLIPGALVGGWIGPWLCGLIGGPGLSLAFGLFLLYPAAVLALGKQPKELFPGKGQTRVGALSGAGVGLVAGTASGLFGIGGGVVMVPALTFLGLDILPAVATSLFVMIPTSAMSAARHAVAGRVHWDLALLLMAGIVVGTQVGPALSARLPAPWLRRLFAVVLVYSALQMILRGLR